MSWFDDPRRYEHLLISVEHLFDILVDASRDEPRYSPYTLIVYEKDGSTTEYEFTISGKPSLGKTIHSFTGLFFVPEEIDEDGTSQYVRVYRRFFLTVRRSQIEGIGLPPHTLEFRAEIHRS